MRVTSLLGRFKHYLVICAVFSLIYSPCNASSKNNPDESRIIECIIVECDDSRHKKITDFTYKKAREYASQNKEFEFGHGMFLESKYDNADRSVDIVRLDENNYLIKLTLENDEIRKSGCLFLINPVRPDWTPLQLENRGDKSLIKPYSFIPDWMNYRAPLLLAYRWSGRYDGESFLDMYVFKEGAFKLILSQETVVDEKKQRVLI